MAAEKVGLRLAKSPLDAMSKRELRVALEALINGVRTITAKLDLDATVTDTDYTAAFDAVVTK